MRAKIIGCVVAVATVLITSGCGFSPYNLPLPGGADLGDKPYTVKVEFRDVLDLVPQSAVRVNDLAVGKVTDIELKGWTALVTLKVNGDAELPDNTEATIRQTSLLGEKFVSLAAPKTGSVGNLGNGDTIPLERAGRNPEIEEVLGAASLLFNGGGLEKTNTIVKELNNALGGNEPEVKELIQSTTSFISQLDDNKADLLTSLEKINRLAITTNDQTDAITGALDELPEALRVVNDQRDDLVKLLESMDRLSAVATGVIRDSKADTVANLRALVPTLTNLTKAGDDLAFATKALLTYPFSDGFLGNSYAKASGKCSDGPDKVKEGACFGDFANLSISLDISAKQLQGLLAGYLPDAAEALPTADATSGEPASPTDELVELVTGLVPDDSGLPSLTPDEESTQEPTPKPTATKKPGGICALLGTCRTAVAGAPDDLAQLLVEPAVAP